jgi:CheY-like chemotaxis protein
MGRRRDERVQIELPVRVFGTDVDGRAFTRLAQTVDVSYSGARISGIYVRLNVNDVLGVQHGAEKGRFRVVWAGERGTSRAGELGLRSLEPVVNFWGLDLRPGGRDDYEAPKAMTERRRHPRYHCDIGVKVKAGVEEHAMYARCTDISIGGCYLETWSPSALGSTLDLDVTLPAGNMNATAVVRTAHPAFGMGVQFVAVQQPALLKDFIDHLAAGSRISANNKPESQMPAPVATTLQRQAAVTALHRQGRVLVAEDSRFLQNAYAYYLRRDGYEVMLAHDGEEALSLAGSERPDVIVLDLLMPKMGGVDALKLLKCDPATSHIPVIVLSGLSQSNETKLISAGALTYLEKNDVGPERLAEYVRRELERYRSQNVHPHVVTVGEPSYHVTT